MNTDNTDTKNGPRDTDFGYHRFLNFGFITLLILVLGVGSWAVFSKIEGAVIGQGRVIVETKPKIIQHLDGGIVREIFVKDGDLVSDGALLMRLDSTSLDASQTIVQTRLFEMLAREGRLLSERDNLTAINWSTGLLAQSDNEIVAQAMDGQQKLFKARQQASRGQIEQLNERITQLGDQISSLESLIQSNQTQVRLIESELDDLKTGVDRGVVARSRYKSVQREQARLEGDIASGESQIAQIQSSIGETRLQILQVKRDNQEKVLTELRDVQTKTSDLREQLITADDQLGRIDVTSPVEGIVHDMAVTTLGGIVIPGQEIMQIIPRGDRLIIEARVMPQDIDQISLMQTATVRLSAFNQRRTPELKAIVIGVSADSLVDEATGLPFYAIKVEIPPEELKRLNGLELLPGMPAEVFMTTQPRTVLSYLLKPVSDSMQRSLREE